MALSLKKMKLKKLKEVCFIHLELSSELEERINFEYNNQSSKMLLVKIVLGFILFR